MLEKLRFRHERSSEKTIERSKVETYLQYGRIVRVASPIPLSAELVDRYQAGYNNMATVTLFRDMVSDEYFYHIEEPPYSPTVENLYNLVRERFQSMEMDIPEKQEEKEEAYRGYIDKVLEELGFADAITKYPQLHYYLIRDIVGWRIIDVPMRDKYVEEVDYSSRKISVAMRHEKIPSTWVSTNIPLQEDESAKFVEFLAFKSGKQISVAQPILEARTPEGYRLAANLKEVSTMPSFTIRKFPERPISITFLVKNKTMSSLMAAYLWTLVEHMRFILVIGGMATGKTTILQAITSAIPSDKKVVTIEDTPELRLENPRWQPLYTRTSLYGTEQNITLETLSRYSLRTRGQYIIIGEVRDKEINSLIQMAASGHGSLCTFHAEDPETLFLRLTSPPLNVRESFLITISAIVLQERVWSKLYQKYIRRTRKIWEITGIKTYTREGEIPINYEEIFTWDPET
ncbi:MAG: type II/IV secretion system ATPase subunit, partial [Thermoprotei archaeon]